MEKATRQQTRHHNSRLVFKTIYEQSPISRADVARQTGLTRPTVSTLVGDLITRQFVAEMGPGPSAGGKPPTLLAVNPDGRHLIAVDLSGNNLRGAITGMDSQFLHRSSHLLGDMRGEDVYRLVEQTIYELESAATAPILGIGVGTPGLVDPRRGIVLHSVNLDWVDFPLHDRLVERFGYPVHVANDSHMAALAEYTFGQNSPSDNLIAIRIGQGIGSGIVLGGLPYYGDGFGAGEIGHVVVEPAGQLCSCGNRGCLEATSGTRGMLRQAQIAATQGTIPWDSNVTISWEDFAEAVRSGNTTAQAITRDAARYLGQALSYLVAGYDIHNIVLAGRISDLGPLYHDAAAAEMERRVLPRMAEAIKLSYSGLGSDIVLLGCIALTLQRELGIV